MYPHHDDGCLGLGAYRWNPSSSTCAISVAVNPGTEAWVSQRFRIASAPSAGRIFSDLYASGEKAGYAVIGAGSVLTLNSSGTASCAIFSTTRPQTRGTGSHST